MTKKKTAAKPTPEPDLSHIAEALRPLAVPIEDLVLDPANARLHDDRNLDAISNSLRRFGQRLPVVVQREGMIVRAGNGRVVAAKEKLGWSHIAAVIVDESEVEATAFAIADNRSAELASWDDEVLARTLQSLPDDALPDVGFSSNEIEKILAELGDPTLPPPPPPPEEPETEFDHVGVIKFDSPDYDEISKALLDLGERDGVTVHLS
jgi:hypothetical protein